jgi:hypothetical protein
MSNKSNPTVATAAPDPVRDCRLTELSPLITGQPNELHSDAVAPHQPKHNHPASSATN